MLQIKRNNVDVAGVIQHAAAHDIFYLANDRTPVIIQKINPGHVKRRACLLKAVNNLLRKMTFSLCELVKRYMTALFEITYNALPIF